MEPQDTEEELSIDSAHGLQTFLSYVEDAYQASYTAAKSVNTEAALTEMVHVEALYAETRALIARYLKILDWGGEIGVDQAELLQEFYNQLIEAHDKISVAQSSTPIIEITDEVEKATFLLERGSHLLEEFSEIKTVENNSPDFKLGKIFYSQLAVSCARVKTIVDEIEGLLKSASADEAVYVVQHFGQELDEIDNHFNQLENSLNQFFESGALEQVVIIENKKSTPLISRNERASLLFETQSPFTTHLKEVMAIPKYINILKNRFSSPAAFEASLRREVYRVEAPSKLDSLLGVKHASAFVFLKDMSLADIDEFDGQKNRENIRVELRKANVPYEIYMNWLAAIPYMEALTDSSDNMSFGELFVRSEIELLSEKVVA